jgi:hypothetical protein
MAFEGVSSSSTMSLCKACIKGISNYVGYLVSTQLETLIPGVTHNDTPEDQFFVVNR